MSLVIDVIVAAIIIFYIFRSAKRGFVRTIIELVGYIAAIVIAVQLSGAIAEWSYNNIFREKAISSISEAVSQSASESTDNQIDEIFEELPSVVESMMKAVGVSRQQIKDSITSGVSENSGSIAEKVADCAVKPVVISIVKFIVVFIVFGVLLFLIRKLAIIVNKAFSIPLVGGINKFLGGALGCAKGMVVAVLFIWVLSIVVSLFKNGILGITQSVIDQSTIAGFINGHNPLI